MQEMRKYSLKELFAKIQQVDDERLFAVAEALRRGVSMEQLHLITGIDLFFLEGFKQIVFLEKNLAEKKRWQREDWQKAKKSGFSDYQLGYLLDKTEDELSLIHILLPIISSLLMKMWLDIAPVLKLILHYAVLKMRRQYGKL